MTEEAVFDMEDFLETCFRTRVKLYVGPVPKHYDWSGPGKDYVLFVTVRIERPADAAPVECPYVQLFRKDDVLSTADDGGLSESGGGDSVAFPPAHSVRVPDVTMVTQIGGREHLLRIEYSVSTPGEGKVDRRVTLACWSKYDMRTLKRWFERRFDASAGSGQKKRGGGVLASLHSGSLSSLGSLGSIGSLSRSFMREHCGEAFLDGDLPFQKWKKKHIMAWIKHVFVTKAPYDTFKEGEPVRIYYDVETLDQVLTKEEMRCFEDYLDRKLGVHNLIDLYQTYLEGKAPKVEKAEEEAEGEAEEKVQVEVEGETAEDIIETVLPVFKNTRFIETVRSRLEEMAKFDNSRFNRDFYQIVRKQLRKGRHFLNESFIDIDVDAKSKGEKKEEEGECSGGGEEKVEVLRLFYKDIDRIRAELRWNPKKRCLWDPWELCRSVMWAQMFRRTISDFVEALEDTQMDMRAFPFKIPRLKHGIKDFWRVLETAIRAPVRDVAIHPFVKLIDHIRAEVGAAGDVQVELLSFKLWLLDKMWQIRCRLFKAGYVSTGATSKKSLSAALVAAEKKKNAPEVAKLQALLQDMAMYKKMGLWVAIKRREHTDIKSVLGVLDPSKIAPTEVPPNFELRKWLWKRIEHINQVLLKKHSFDVNLRTFGYLTKHQTKAHEAMDEARTPETIAKADNLDEAVKLYLMYDKLVSTFFECAVDDGEWKSRVAMMMDPKRAEVMKGLIESRLRETLREDETRVLPVKLIIAKNSKDDVSKNPLASLLAKALPIAQRIVGVGAPWGYFHALFSIGNCRFEWNDNGLVRFQILASQDSYEEVFVADLETPTISVVSRSTYESKMLTIAKALVKHNADHTYALVGRAGTKGENCQQFTMRFIQKELKVDSFPKMVRQFVKRANSPGASMSPEDFVKQSAEFHPSKEFRTKFYPTNKDDAAYGILSKVKPKNDCFRDHDQLDRYAEVLLQVCEDPLPDFREEWQYLQALDRAFWMRELKRTKGKTSRQYSSCPFNVFEAKCMRELHQTSKYGSTSTMDLLEQVGYGRVAEKSIRL